MLYEFQIDKPKVPKVYNLAHKNKKIKSDLLVRFWFLYF